MSSNIFGLQMLSVVILYFCNAMVITSYNHYVVNIHDLVYKFCHLMTIANHMTLLSDNTKSAKHSL